MFAGGAGVSGGAGAASAVGAVARRDPRCAGCCTAHASGIGTGEPNGSWGGPIEGGGAMGNGKAAGGKAATPGKPAHAAQ